MTMPTHKVDPASTNIHPKKRGKRMVPLRYVLMPFAFIFAAITVLIIIGAFAPKPAKKPIDIKAPLVEIKQLVRGDVTLRVKSQGSILPRTETNIVAEVSGRIIFVAEQFNAGGFFRKGDVLLKIDPTDYELAVQQAEARLDTANANLLEEQARTEQAREEWLLSGKQVEDAPIMALRKPQMQKAQADVNSAKAERQKAQVQLSRTTIKSPYHAMVKVKQADIGQYVTPGSVLAGTFAIDYAEARLPIKQNDMPYINLPDFSEENNKGDEVTLSMNVGGKKREWISYISRYEGVVDTSSRVHYVIAKIDDPYAYKRDDFKHPLHIGSFVKAEIKGKMIKDIVAIPHNAIYGANEIYQVSHDNKLVKTLIESVYSDSEYLYTEQSLDLTMPLVMTKLETPVEGMSLRIKGNDNEQIALNTKNQEE
ncbi:efflux RND transporter periplasmic adaptor subunit [Thalassotalea fusca]